MLYRQVNRPNVLQRFSLALPALQDATLDAAVSSSVDGQLYAMAKTVNGRIEPGVNFGKSPLGEAYTELYSVSFYGNDFFLHSDSVREHWQAVFPKDVFPDAVDCSVMLTAGGPFAGLNESTFVASCDCADL
jgi:hypothetical protein